MTLSKKSENLWLVNLDQQLAGYRQFISCWIFHNEDITFLVDPGPASTIAVVSAALKTLNIKRIDFILLTHIHIDHAGGSGLLIREFPQAEIICHSKGIPHMIDPEKLWQGSLKVLGKVAEVYKPIVPVPQKSIRFNTLIQKGKTIIEVYETPGHAAHHLCFLVKGILFSGEAAGVTTPLKTHFYLRPATPPQFIYPVYKESLYKISALKCKAICFGHYGISEDVTAVFKAAAEQLELWMTIIKTHFSASEIVNPEKIFKDLLDRDLLLMGYSLLEKDIQQREKYFICNSIKGMLGYFTDQK